MDEIDELDDYADSGDSEDDDLAEAYYEAKDKKSTGSDTAVDAFERVLTLEQRDSERTVWGFKALKQLLKLGAAKESTEMLRNYKRILAYHSAVTDSQMEKACLKVVAFLADVESFREFGQMTNAELRDAKWVLWSRIAMRLARTLFTCGHDDDALLVLADVKNTVQDNSRMAAVADSLLLDVYKVEAEIRIRKWEFEQIAELHAAAHSLQWDENPVALAVIKECFAIPLILKSQYALAETELIAAAKIHHDECSEHAPRCRQLLAMNAALRTWSANEESVVLLLRQQNDSRVLAASELARLYQTEHGDAFLTEAQKFLAEDADPLVVCVLEQWTSRVRKAQAEINHCLEYPPDGCLARNAVFQADRFAHVRKEFEAETDEYVRKLCVTRAWAAELQYWLRLGEDDRGRDVVNRAFAFGGDTSSSVHAFFGVKSLFDQGSCEGDVKDSSAALLREFCGRTFFEQGCLDYAQRSLRASLRDCSTDRAHGCIQLLVLVDLLLGEDDDVAQQNLEKATLDVLRQLAKYICTFEPDDCARLLSDAVCLARVDPFIVKSLQEWIAKMEPVKECLREVEAQQALEKSELVTAMQRVEELKQKVKLESNETVKFLCRMQLCAAELQIAYAAGDLKRLRGVLAVVPYCVFMPRSVKVVDDQTSAAGIIHEFHGRMKLFDGKMSEALSALLFAAQSYAKCGSERLVACKQLVLFCRLVQNAAGGHDFPSTEASDEALLELLVPLTAAIAKADLGAIRNILDSPSFAELTNNGLHEAVQNWLGMLEDSNRILTKEGQELVDRREYDTLDQRLREVSVPPEDSLDQRLCEVTIPPEICDKLTRDTWIVRLWSLQAQLWYYTRDNYGVDRRAVGMEELPVSVQHSEPAGILLEFSGKRYLRSNDRPRALERFQRALQIFEINDSNRRHAVARYIALTLRPNQPLTDHLHEQYASEAGVVAVRDLMDAYYADERDRFYELLQNSRALLLDAFIIGRLGVHYDALKARICSRPIEFPTDTCEVVLSMLKSDQFSIQNSCRQFRETFANVFDTPRS